MRSNKRAAVKKFYSAWVCRNYPNKQSSLGRLYIGPITVEGNDDVLHYFLEGARLSITTN